MKRKFFDLVTWFLLLLTVSSARKCTKMIKTITVVECEDISSINDISLEIEPTWNDLVITNPAAGIFIITDSTINHMDIIEKLDLSRVGAITISEQGFQQFKGLKQLNLSGLRLRLMEDSWFSSNNSIESLDMSNNLIDEINVKNLENLKTANFSHNEIPNVENTTLQHMTNLEVLDLSHNKMKQVDLGEVPSLKKLNLSNNLISELPANGFSGMPNLEELVITSNDVSNIEGKAFFGLTELKLLDLSANNIERIERDTFEGLSCAKIEVLNLSSNKIKYLPPGRFKPLPLLQSLDLSKNSLTELGERTFAGLHSLRRLYLYYNFIATIGDDTFANLTSLELVHLSGNDLQMLNDKMFGTHAHRLKRLWLKSNNIEHVSPDFFQATPNLEYLSLTANKIKALDDNIFEPLKRLQSLHLGRNLIEEFSSTFMNNLELLSELWIDHNKLTFLPDTNHSFPNLIKATIEGNPWQCTCLDDIISFFESKGVDYRKKNYFDGKRPACVPTAVKMCVKDIEFVRKKKLVETYETILRQ